MQGYCSGSLSLEVPYSWDTESENNHRSVWRSVRNCLARMVQKVGRQVDEQFCNFVLSSDAVSQESSVSPAERNPTIALFFNPEILSVLRSNGVWLPQLGRVVANKILPTSKRKGWCCHDTSLSSFIPGLFVNPALFQRSEFLSLRLSLPHKLSDA